MKHPFDALSDPQTRRAFAASLVLLIIVATALILTGTPLRTASAPAGIISFELCAFGDRCEAMLTEYAAAPGPLAVGFALGIDYLFLFVYPTAIALALKLAARGKSTRVVDAAAALSWAAIVAGALDGIENAALLVMAWDGHATPLYGWTAAFAASTKFALLAIALVGALALLSRPRVTR